MEREASEMSLSGAVLSFQGRQEFPVGVPPLGTKVALMCPVCSKLFHGRNKKQHLHYHMMTHTGEKPFHCPHCPHRANRLSNLRIHVKTKHSLLN